MHHPRAGKALADWETCSRETICTVTVVTQDIHETYAPDCTVKRLHGCVVLVERTSLGWGDTFSGMHLVKFSHIS